MTATQNGSLWSMRPDEEMKFAPNELEFLAEEELVEIVPKISFMTVQLLSGPVGPFEPLVPTMVPLWFALQLRERQMATIQLPDWLQETELKELKEEEEHHRETNYMTPVQFHYQEIATLLLRHSPDSFSGVDGQAKIDMKDVEEMREAKLHESLHEMQGYHGTTKIPNISAMEINRIRPFILNSIHRFRDLKDADDSFSGAQSQSYDSQNRSL